MSHLLIIGCSRRKRLDAEPIPAIDRHDGPLFRYLRRYLAMRPAHSLQNPAPEPHAIRPP
ncbi:hypothetical protein HRbin26_00509 [bacterium HR26]|nr:hypothetical protein HRbin26_00509 [bacterium HR26]